ncbi:MAG: hypothetical protein H7257_09760 [Taibaiella sp.]|nr:hypothetical protein [Taibaiella sp.]
MASNNFAHDSFINNIASVDSLLSIHKILIQTFPLLKNQADELLRAVIVLSVSALDNYLHDFYRTEIVEGFLGTGNFNVKFDKIKISVQLIKDLENAFSDDQKRKFLHDEVRKMQKTESFQSQRSIENIFEVINIKNIWSKLEGIMHVDAKKIKDELSLIIDRRNKISHESDWDYFNQRKNLIDAEEVNAVVRFVETFANAVNVITP